MATPIKCEVSFEELEKYRDKEGFINLDALNLEFTEASREKVGNKDRIKNWVDFSGTEALIKGECRIENKRNGMIFAELIVEELAKQAGLPAAYYDLVKIKGQYGVLSKNMLQKDKDELFSLQSLIGDTIFYDEYPEISSYIESEEKLYQSLKEEKIEIDNIKNIIKDFRKQTAFFIMLCSVDKHPENVSFITYINPETKKKEERLAPVYDSEYSLMLDMDLESLEKLTRHGLGLKRNVDMLDPKIVVLDGDYQSLWRNTLDTLCDDDEVYDFILDCYEELNIDKAIESVEKKIKAPLPEVVKLTAKYVFQFRKKEIEKILYPELEQDNLASQYSKQISNKSVEEGLRQGEEDEMLRRIMHIYGIEEKNYARG